MLHINILLVRIILSVFLILLVLVYVFILKNNLIFFARVLIILKFVNFLRFSVSAFLILTQILHLLVSRLPIFIQSKVPIGPPLEEIITKSDHNQPYNRTYKNHNLLFIQTSTHIFLRIIIIYRQIITITPILIRLFDLILYSMHLLIKLFIVLIFSNFLVFVLNICIVNIASFAIRFCQMNLSIIPVK